MRPSPSPSFESGAIIAGKYRLDQLLGSGGMGAVHRATQLMTGRRVAVKCLHAEADDLTRRRFVREARALGAIDHPGVVGVLDVGDCAGDPFLVMEYLEGKSLRAYARKRLFTPTEALQLLMPVLEGMAAVHEAGIVHRDLKPENIFVRLDEDETAIDAKVVDFGVARFGSDSTLTRSGTTIGTPRYMAPEQFRGDADVDARADVFALGLVLYELLAGRLPYNAETYEVLILEIATTTPTSPCTFNPDLSVELGQVILRACAKERDQRFPDVATFARALEPFVEGIRFRPPRRGQFRAADTLEDSDEIALDAPATGAPTQSLPTAIVDVDPAHGMPTVVGSVQLEGWGAVHGAQNDASAQAVLEDTERGLAREKKRRSRGIALALVLVAAMGFAYVIAASAAGPADPTSAAPRAVRTVEPSAVTAAPVALPTEPPVAPPVATASPSAPPVEEATSIVHVATRVSTSSETRHGTTRRGVGGTEARGRAGILRRDDL